MHLLKKRISVWFSEFYSGSLTDFRFIWDEHVGNYLGGDFMATTNEHANFSFAKDASNYYTIW